MWRWNGGARAIDLESNNIGHTVDGNFILDMHGAPALAFANAAIRISSSGTGADNGRTTRSETTASTTSTTASPLTARILPIREAAIWSSTTRAPSRNCAAFTAILPVSTALASTSRTISSSTRRERADRIHRAARSGFRSLTKPVYGAYNCTTCAANATIISFKGSTASNTHASVIAFDGTPTTAPSTSPSRARRRRSR